MPTYAIGDIHGCYDTLQNLLDHIRFDPAQDRLWFVGDLINRGAQSLQVLRFVKNLPNAVTVLGNHECLLLDLASGAKVKQHTLQEILQAPDKDPLLNWIRTRPLLYEDKALNCVMVHAGIYPFWTLAQAKIYAKEVEGLLKSDHYQDAIPHLYTHSPIKWDETYPKGWKRLRFIINAFTRMRFCRADGLLSFEHTGAVGTQPLSYQPWFHLNKARYTQKTVLFGHWAALMGETQQPNLFALDTGCIWGGYLTALRLEDRQHFRVRSKQRKVMA